jgi:hypothetical protein
MVAVAVGHEGAIDTYTKHHFTTLQADFLTPGLEISLHN